jgi:hypothetical protein
MDSMDTTPEMLIDILRTRVKEGRAEKVLIIGVNDQEGAFDVWVAASGCRNSDGVVMTEIAKSFFIKALTGQE